MEKTMSPADVWWGLSTEKKSWVVLDRAIATNRPGEKEPLIFFSCKDWTLYKEERNKWDAPNYYHEKYFLERLSSDIKSRHQIILDKYKSEFSDKRLDLYTQLVQMRHTDFLLDVSKVGCDAIAPSGKRRTSHCWNCKRKVDNFTDLQGSLCGWIICSMCGACGCGYSSDRSYHKYY